MRNLSGRVSSIAFIIVYAAPATARAHDYWLERESDKVVLYQGHKHGTHRGEERVPYAIDIVRNAFCMEQNGQVVDLPKSSTYPARFDARCLSTLVELSSGYWSQTLTNTVNKPRTEVPGTLKAWRSEESVKHLHAWTPRLLSSFSSGLELVPLHNVLELETGRKVRLVAFWQGKPRSGVMVAYDGDVRGVTGDDGQINLLVRHGGRQVIAATFESPVNEPNASKAIRSTILQFDIGK